MVDVKMPKWCKDKIEYEANMEVGGWYNSYTDEGEEGVEHLKSVTLSDLVDSIYGAVVSDYGGMAGRKKEIRFLGTNRIKACILKYLEPDVKGGDIAELQEIGVWLGDYDELMAEYTGEKPAVEPKKEDKKDTPAPAVEKKPSSNKGKSLDEYWAELKALGGECKVYSDERIQRMRLVMAIKKAKAGK